MKTCVHVYIPPDRVIECRSVGHRQWPFLVSYNDQISTILLCAMHATVFDDHPLSGHPAIVYTCLADHGKRHVCTLLYVALCGLQCSHNGTLF